MQIDMKDIAYVKSPYKPFALADNDVVALIWHDGSSTEAGTAVTAATITATADTSLTCSINGAADARIGATGVLDDGTYATWGAMVDAIEVAKGWHCQLVGVIRATKTVESNAGIGAVAETSCFKVAVEMKMDTSDVWFLGCGIVDAGYGKSLDGWRPVLYGLDGISTFSSGTGRISVYDCDDVAKTEKEVLRFTTATATAKAYPTYGPSNQPIYMAPAGHRIVVMHINSAVMSGAGDFIQATGFLIKET